MANGVLLVDTKLANNGQSILDEVKKVTDKPITHIVNTHTHGDHTGSNQFFPADVQIVVQENTAANMAKMDVFKEAANKHGWPTGTYKVQARRSSSGKEEVELRYFGPAHTDGDTFRGVQERARDALGRRLGQQGHAFIDRATAVAALPIRPRLKKRRARSRT
jgi:glyoxylase-like metal-dependent hydrolase (beta-lactamase superfamily II)